MTKKTIGIKEETAILLNRARSVLIAENPQKRYTDDTVIFTALTQYLSKK